MPYVSVTLIKGRTVEQKRKIVSRIADVLVEEANAKREAVHVIFYEVEREDVSTAGVLISDKK